MYSSLLVPLDGSPFAEQALPVAVALARRHGAALHLVSAHTALVRPLEVQGAPVYDTRFDEDRKRELRDYLAATAERVRSADGIEVSYALVEGGSAAEAIAEEAGRRDVGLLVLTSHGRGGFSRFWLGSVTSELLRCSPVPVLVARSSEEAAVEPLRTGGPSHVLVPLDGSQLAESALDAALELARPAAARCTVLRVVRTADTLLPYDQTFWTPAEQEYLDEQQAAARAYVDGVVGRLRAEGIEADGIVTVEPDAARAILREASERGADLIAMSTHARAGVARLFLGSVTDKVIRASECPVLAARPSE